MSHSLTDSILYVEAEERQDRYPIRRATWNLYEEAIGAVGVPFFCVRIEAGYPLYEGAEAPTYQVEPFWEVNYADSGLRSSKLLVKGASSSFPSGTTNRLTDI
jgi:hypothetical protein